MTTMPELRRMVDSAVACINACQSVVAQSKGQRVSRVVQPSPCRRCGLMTLSDVRGPCIDDRAGFCPACYAAELKWNEEHNK